jgi:uncharacterized coiled-coil DUF342 family protein
MVRRKTPRELESAQIKYDSFVQKRDQLNAEANLVRQERDALHEKRRAFMEELTSLKRARSKLLDEMRVHKDQRNGYQAKAKDLIEVKKTLRGRLRGNVEAELKGLRKRIEDLEMKQQTSSLTIPQENALLVELKGHIKGLKDLEQFYKDHQAVLAQVGEIDGQIDDLFRRAEQAHQAVLALSQQAQELQAEVVERVKEASLLIAEANKQHEAYIRLRERADEYHQNAQEMRTKIIAVRRSRREEAMEARRLVQEHKAAVRAALEDEEKSEEAAEKALQSLLKKGRIDLRP